MDKQKILEKYKNENDKLLISKLFDKIGLTEKQNKIQVTDFYSPIELEIVKNILNTINYKNYEIYGKTRNMVIMYPDKLESVFKENKFDYNTICNCIRISNCTENYEHKIYLGGCIKLGVKREKIGDIIVFENGADIVVNKDVTKFLLNNLQELNRFKKSNIEIINLSEITQKEQEFKEMKIIVSSLRLDNIVSELAKTSRSKALDLLKLEKIFINYKNENKATKSVCKGDIITIRGTGKFIINEILGNTKSGKYVIDVKKYI